MTNTVSLFGIAGFASWNKISGTFNPSSVINDAVFAQIGGAVSRVLMYHPVCRATQASNVLGLPALNAGGWVNSPILGYALGPSRTGSNAASGFLFAQNVPEFYRSTAGGTGERCQALGHGSVAQDQMISMEVHADTITSFINVAPIPTTYDALLTRIEAMKGRTFGLKQVPGSPVLKAACTTDFANVAIVGAGLALYTCVDVQEGDLVGADIEFLPAGAGLDSARSFFSLIFEPINAQSQNVTPSLAGTLTATEYPAPAGELPQILPIG